MCVCVCVSEKGINDGIKNDLKINESKRQSMDWNTDSLVKKKVLGTVVSKARNADWHERNDRDWFHLPIPWVIFNIEWHSGKLSRKNNLWEEPYCGDMRLLLWLTWLHDFFYSRNFLSTELGGLKYLFANWTNWTFLVNFTLSLSLSLSLSLYIYIYIYMYISHSSYRNNVIQKKLRYIHVYTMKPQILTYSFLK